MLPHCPLWLPANALLPRASVLECGQPSGAFARGARQPVSETDGLNREQLEARGMNGRGMNTGQNHFTFSRIAHLFQFRGGRKTVLREFCEFPRISKKHPISRFSFRLFSIRAIRVKNAPIPPASPDLQFEISNLKSSEAWGQGGHISLQTKDKVTLSFAGLICEGKVGSAGKCVAGLCLT
jgi:hypothetical protein